MQVTCLNVESGENITLVLYKCYNNVVMATEKALSHRTVGKSDHYDLLNTIRVYKLNNFNISFVSAHTTYKHTNCFHVT